MAFFWKHKAQHFISQNVASTKHFEQECIPVGCLPPAAVAVCWVWAWRSPGCGPGDPPWVWTLRPPRCRPGDPPWIPARHAGIPSAMHAGIPSPPPHRTEFLTHASENITLPQTQTSFAGGN